MPPWRGGWAERRLHVYNSESSSVCQECAWRFAAWVPATRASCGWFGLPTLVVPSSEMADLPFTIDIFHATLLLHRGLGHRIHDVRRCITGGHRPDQTKGLGAHRQEADRRLALPRRAEYAHGLTGRERRGGGVLRCELHACVRTYRVIRIRVALDLLLLQSRPTVVSLAAALRSCPPRRRRLRRSLALAACCARQARARGFIQALARATLRSSTWAAGTAQSFGRPRGRRASARASASRSTRSSSRIPS